MRVPTSFLDSIVFFYGSEDDANDGTDPLGTGFCVFVCDADKTKTHVYLVTNDHVVRGTAPFHVVRGMSRITGKPITYPTSQHEWYPHPDGADLAVCYLGCDIPTDLASFLGAEDFVTRKQMEDEYVGIGDACMMVGCFNPHSGTHVNLPAVRFGNVSIMPIEPVAVGRGRPPQECFLVEMRSRGGFSGSPVFLVPQIAFGDQPSYDPSRNQTLGVCCGHLQEMRTIKFTDPLNADGGYIETKIQENSGMAMVIPAHKLHDLLFSDELMAERKKEEAPKKRTGGSRNASASLDSVEPKRGPVPERLSIPGDWEKAVEKALKRKPQR